jgi:NAD kinase
VKKDLHLPRLVLVTRKTPLELLLEQHGTLAQARFYLQSRGQEMDEYAENHERFEDALARVLGAIPPDQRRVRLDRGALDRFLFSPDDVVVIVGQDGLVPNTAKYLQGQVTMGINPDAERYDGVLCPHAPRDIDRLLAWLEFGEGEGYRVQSRAMAVAKREDGQRLLALNEVFVGHRSHQSAKYRIQSNGREERQSSSGLLCATGTGSTGWVRSIVEQRALEIDLPTPEQPRLAWFVREPFPSVYTGTDLDHGIVGPGQELVIHSEMGNGGVVFADGIEVDNIQFLQGHTLRLVVAENRLNLVVPVAQPDLRSPQDL